MKFESINLLKVFLNFSQDKNFFVGRLGYDNQRIIFEYDKDFLKHGIEISPIKLPLQANLSSCDDELFDGLYGVFNDSLPDAWGRLLIDRKLRQNKIEPSILSPLDRLSLVGNSGFGALCYEPERNLDTTNITSFNINLDNLYRDSLKIMEGSSESIDELLSFSASAGGARPKISVLISKDKKKFLHHKSTIIPNDFEHWLIKFCASQDLGDLGSIEYAYSLMAKKAGIEMSDTYLFKTKKLQYFGTKRFDINASSRLHIHSASGLLHADHRYPSLDYENLLKLTLILSKDMQEVIKVYRQAVFNVFAHNRDDHTKNFSFIMDKTGKWKTAPAYDLTFSYGPGGEHSMMICGEGKNPSSKELKELAKKFDIKNYQEIIESTKDAVSQWKRIAKDCEVSSDSIKIVEEKLKAVNNA